jgi:hypothetical protein
VDSRRSLALNVVLPSLVTLSIWSIPALPVIIDLLTMLLAVVVIGRWVRWGNSAVLVGALATVIGAATNGGNSGRTLADIVGNCIVGAVSAGAMWALGIRISRRRLLTRSPE